MSYEKRENPQNFEMRFLPGFLSVTASLKKGCKIGPSGVFCIKAWFDSKNFFKIAKIWTEVSWKMPKKN